MKRKVKQIKCTWCEKEKKYIGMVECSGCDFSSTNDDWGQFYCSWEPDPQSEPQAKQKLCPIRKMRVRTNDTAAGVVYEFYEEFCSCIGEECAWYVHYPGNPNKSCCALAEIAVSINP